MNKTVWSYSHREWVRHAQKHCNYSHTLLLFTILEIDKALWCVSSCESQVTSQKM